jgi:hypothetical protein
MVSELAGGKGIIQLEILETRFNIVEQVGFD